MWKDPLLRHGFVLLGTRLVVASIFLWHGLPKAMNPEMAAAKFLGFSLPRALGTIVGAVEVIAAILVIAGVWHLWANLALATVITGALLTVQIPNGISAGLERDLLILVATLVLAVHGLGRFSVTLPVSRRVSAVAG